MKVSYQEFGDTMEDIAKNHVDIRHSAEECHFAVISTSGYKDHLGRVNIEEVVNGIKSKLKTPYLLADLPDIGFDDEKGDNKSAQYAGAFIVIVKSSSIALGDQLPDISKAQSIAADVLAWFDEKMDQAWQGGNPQNEWMINFGEALMSVVTMKGNMCGVRVELPYSTPSQAALEYKSEKWVTPL